MNFPDLVTNRRVVDNVENYLNVKFQPKILTRSRENAKKHKIAYNFFSRNFDRKYPAVSVSYYYHNLTSCTKAKKSLESNSRTFRNYNSTVELN